MGSGTILELLRGFGSQEEAGAWIERALDIDNSHIAIDELLGLLGRNSECDRAYIFEYGAQETINNTYEWCAKDIRPQKELLQGIPQNVIGWWLEFFKEYKPVVIPDLEQFKESQPVLYSALKVQDIHSLIVIPLWKNDENIGFIGVDNPKLDDYGEIIEQLESAATILTNMLSAKHTIEELSFLAHHDRLTRVYNRNAFEAEISKKLDSTKLGVVYADVKNLKHINARYGQKSGDDLLKRCSELLRRVFTEYGIYRIGGDEFAVLCYGIEDSVFHERLQALRLDMGLSKISLHIGSYWSDNANSVIEIVDLAQNDLITSPLGEGNGAEDSRRNDLSITQSIDDTLLDHFMTHNYFNMDIFFKALARSNCYSFFGDMQSNQFFISDELRELVGAEENIVHDLLRKWERVIKHKEDLELYRQDILNITLQKRSIHDIRYRILGRDGNEFWVRCCGIIHWSEGREYPLFFAGSVSKLEYEFIIDPITNLPREHGATLKLEETFLNFERIAVIGITLNSFREVNEAIGRTEANAMLQEIVSRLVEKFDGKIQFFRLDGLKFIAIPVIDIYDSINKSAEDIRSVIEAIYLKYNIPLKFPCAICVMQKEQVDSSFSALIDELLRLLDFAKENPYQECITYSAKRLEEHSNKHQMFMALNRDAMYGCEHFRVVIQPVVSAEDFKVTSGELLLRWSFEGKDVSPSFFIPLLESNQQILTVGRWVVEQAILHCKRIVTYKPDFRLNFNVSYHQILDRDFLPFIEQGLKMRDITGDHFVVEITETHAIESPEILENFITACQALGMRVAFDDFGTGYSSLELLLRHPSDVIKLDRTFTQAMTSSESNNNFISSMVDSCHRFGKKVCAEGIENKDELDTVIKAGCDMIQGYYFYKPMELDEFYQLIARQAEESHAEES